MLRSSVRRIGRYRLNGAVYFGQLADDGYQRLTAAPWEGGALAREFDRFADVEPLAPVAPGKIVCVGLNYRAHIAESASVLPGAVPALEPLLFLKPPSAVIGHGGVIRYPVGVTRLDPEAEMAVVIGRVASRVPVALALDHVAGITAFNDVSARNYQKLDGQWTRAKGFDTFAPLGPWVALGCDPSDQAVKCRVNGVERQHGHTRDLLFPVPELVSFISGIMTLQPGDVIATGTPAGIGPVEIGDHIEIEVDDVGVLSNRVEAARS
ncbi:MAG: fumarylacetoacetate hydrolase family protein [Candidatus Eisenbacteria bacterium]|uniref:Fumarylacetoacetate hydrolase family protein n=1 Tax=Eiseniibacteriota bacterium TaxID=2212470 RepID=A0A849SHS4_UNCEI|nr:fumarylacetoacetate hydrolase family protein [Candidatus Eisenbacteria bacterium]